MNKKYDVVALGELLIDFIQNDTSVQGNPLFEANPGGAPCNVLAMLNKLGHKTAFIGKVGKDIFGQQLKAVLEELEIDTTNLLMDETVRTTLAFVANDATGERSFSFYRSPGADMMLTADEVQESMITSARVFHFGTLSMTHEGVREATRRALRIAKENNLLISFDPNLRESLWDSLENAKKQVDYGLRYCDVLKISDNEIQWFTGKEDFDEGVNILQEKYHIPLILLSMGRDGSRAYYDGMKVEVPGFIQKNTIETTGAGDTFMGSCLHFILEKGMDSLTGDENGWTESELREMLTFANAAASIITTRKGALKVMPEKEAVEGLSDEMW
ncbi:MAG: carbohydrate kinase [Lachnospiraceae bacterium]|nr:carbohydrate kinase [Lachnospiraceae bacterium]